ncbi:nuclear transport factor 2 family protein [Okibacterium fritillariae]|uniref:nuclear transport factor 2 family protein n=1 Tax=Okibacterium fritillariae TaxID=123320 RepID=UPI00405539A2
MTTQPATIARIYFEALRRGDVPTLMNQFAQDVVWHQPGENRFSGIHRGVDSVGALIGGMMRLSDGSFALEVTGPLMANGDLVAVPVRFTGRREDASMDMSGVDLLTVRDGKIVEMHLFSEDGAAEDAFWGTV